MNNKKINFCTLFNSAYLSRGVLLYRSLERSGADFHLYVFAFDIVTYEYLKSQNYPKLTVISLAEFEDEKLLSIKASRSASEYCWTCTASTILYSIEKFGLESCTYIDADMCFYANPGILIEEMGDKSVLITEHRYTKDYDQSPVSGKYCVQFVCIKNTPEGMKVLRKWREDCIDWCYDRAEDGKFGDQKYLDNWSNESNSIHELQHLGGGLAPWNMQQYDFEKRQDGFFGLEKATGKTFPVIFFHFHGLKLFKNGIVSLTGPTYRMNNSAKKLFYIQYVKEIGKISEEIQIKMNCAYNVDGASKATKERPFKFLSLLRYYLYDVRKSLSNINGKKTKERKFHHHYFWIDDLIKE
jgi:hypothetical protein